MNVPTTSRTTIRKSISADEMLYLRREEGLSNQEIAERCGVAYSTVCRYIGGQGFRRPNSAPAKERLPAEPSAKKESKLLKITEQTLNGTVASFVLAPKQSLITIKAQTETSTVEALLSFKEAVLFAEELQEAILSMTTLGG